jgi:hypothetical protein
MTLLLTHPWLILLIAVFFWVGFILARRKGAPRPRALLVAALAWTAWFLWEWAIRAFSPEANIRADLLLILPVVGLASLAGLLLPLIPRKKR